MIPDLKPTSKKNKKSNILTAFLGIILITSSICFTVMGVFNLFRAFLTEYNLKTLDLMYFTSGILILFSIAIVNVLTEMRDQNQTIAKGVLHLLKNKVSPSPKPAGNFSDIIQDLLGRQSGVGDENISGSISMYDISNPDEEGLKQHLIKNLYV